MTSPSQETTCASRSDPRRSRINPRLNSTDQARSGTNPISTRGHARTARSIPGSFWQLGTNWLALPDDPRASPKMFTHSASTIAVRLRVRGKTTRPRGSLDGRSVLLRSSRNRQIVVSDDLDRVAVPLRSRALPIPVPRATKERPGSSGIEKNPRRNWPRLRWSGQIQLRSCENPTIRHSSSTRAVSRV